MMTVAHIVMLLFTLFSPSHTQSCPPATQADCAACKGISWGPGVGPRHAVCGAGPGPDDTGCRRRLRRFDLDTEVRRRDRRQTDGTDAPQSSSPHAASMLGDIGLTTVEGTDELTNNAFCVGENIFVRVVFNLLCITLHLTIILWILYILRRYIIINLYIWTCSNVINRTPSIGFERHRYFLLFLSPYTSSFVLVPACIFSSR